MNNKFHRMYYIILAALFLGVTINLLYTYFANKKLNKICLEQNRYKKKLTDRLIKTKIAFNGLIYQKEYLKLELMVRNYIPFNPRKINLDFIEVRGRDSSEYAINNQIIMSFKNYLNFKYKLSNRKSKLPLEKETSLNAYFSSYESKIGWLVDDKEHYLLHRNYQQEMNRNMKIIKDSLQSLDMKVLNILNN